MQSFQPFPPNTPPSGLNMRFVHNFDVESCFLILLSIFFAQTGNYWQTCIAKNLYAQRYE